MRYFTMAFPTHSILKGGTAEIVISGLIVNNRFYKLCMTGDTVGLDASGAVVTDLDVWFKGITGEGY